MTPSFATLRARVLAAVCLLVLKAVSSFVSIPHGLQATYFAQPQWTGPVVSRIDARVSVGRDTGTTAPGLSAVWQGYAPVRSGVNRQAFYLRGRGVTAELWVDGFQAVHLEAAPEREMEEVQPARWDAALHRVIVRMTSANDRPPQFDAGLVMTDGAKAPFAENLVLARPAPSWRIAADRALRPLIPWINLLLAAVLIWAGWRVVAFMVPPEEQ